MNFIKHLALFSLVPFIMSTQLKTAEAQQTKSTGNIVATVNGKPIYKSQFEERYRQSLLFVSKKPVSKQKVLEELINRELGIEKAEKSKLAANPIVKTKLEDVLFHAQISKDLENQFTGIVVKDDDVKAYYKEYREYRTRHILFRLRAKPSEVESKAALEQALKIYGVLRKTPDKFPELANKYSQSSTAGSGGDLGFQPAVRYAPEYYKAIKDRKPGFISPPVQTQYGYHLIEVLAEKDFKEINMPLYRKIVYDEKRDGIILKYFDGLRSNAKIKINKEML